MVLTIKEVRSRFQNVSNGHGDCERLIVYICEESYNGCITCASVKDVDISGDSGIWGGICKPSCGSRDNVFH